MKRILSAMILGTLCILACGIFTGCGGGSTTDPDVKAYDEWWIRTHDIFGNPR